MLLVEPMAYVHPDASRTFVASPPGEALRSLLVPVPRSGIPDRVVDRLGRLPIAYGATVTLVHVRSRFRPVDADALLADVAEQVASILPSAKLDRVLTSGPTMGAIRELAHAIGAELLVMAPAEHALRRLVLGATTTRIVRHSHSPVLVVRGEVTAAYQRPLVAIGLDEAARGVLTFARRVLPTPCPTTTVVHVYDAPFEGLMHPSLDGAAADAHRENCRQRAERKLLDLLGGIRPHDCRWSRYLQYGEPRAVIATAAAQLRGDLVVLGTHARSIVGHALLGSVAADVVRRAPCDVLVVPPHLSV